MPLVDVVTAEAEILFTMMAPEYYIFTGERVPDHVTHVIIDKALKFVRARAFYEHPNIEEVICHDGVEKVELRAFRDCPRLRRVIMPGVIEVEERAIYRCTALTYIVCGKLEIIRQSAFGACKSLNSIDLPSIKIIELNAFLGCTNLTSAKFGKDLESIGQGAFYKCTSLERITLPLKDGVITATAYDTFQYCEKLKSVDLVERAVLNETIDALLLEEWKTDINEKIDSISQNLARAHPGSIIHDVGKARAIRVWITSVLHKIVRYKADHRCYLNEAATALYSALPNDIVIKNILPFLELPSHTFEGED